MRLRKASRWVAVPSLALLLSSASTEAAQSWIDQCAMRIGDAFGGKTNGSDSVSPWPQLVGPNGLHEGNWRPDNAWGITYDECKLRCEGIYGTFQFSNFSTSVTNWLLPWLALTAQLPYETSSPFNNVLSALLAVGSPPLATYSMILTVLNRFQIASDFRSLVDEIPDQPGYRQLVDRIGDAAYILQETAQAPIRVSEASGALSSLMVLPDNHRWWKEVRKSLEGTRRPVSISLIAQTLVAVVAWVFTIVAAFDDVGDTTTALAISSSSIWLWMVPVVIGFVSVGTQCRPKAVESALKSWQCYCTPENSSTPSLVEQNGIRTFTEKRSTSTDLNLDLATVGTPEKYSVCLTGLEGKEGPAFNFARVFTSWHFANVVDEGFRTMIANIKAQRSPTGDRISSLLNLDHHLVGNSVQLSRYCGFDERDQAMHNFPPWSEIPSRLWRNMGVAAFIAMFVLWGTTGPSLLIAFLTPSTGLGCRSGSYLLYGCLATVSWLLLLGASLSSHAFMQRFERKLKCLKDPEGYDQDSLTHGPLPIITVLCEVSGCAIAASNAFWLLVISVMELAGAFESCWCQAVYMTRRKKAYVLLFVGSDVLGPMAQPVWVGGILFLAIVCGSTIVFIGLGCKRRI